MAHAQGGYFVFDEIPGLGEPNVQIDLDPAMLGLVTEATKPSNPQAADAIASIKGVRVLVYEDIEDHLEAVRTYVDETSRKLERDGWRRTVYIRDGDENVRVYVKLGDPATAAKPQAAGTVAGMTVMVIDGDSEAVFINVTGPIDPAELGGIASGFGLGGALDSVGGGGSRGRDQDQDRE
jgi:hypothetical protein